MFILDIFCYHDVLQMDLRPLVSTMMFAKGALYCFCAEVHVVLLSDSESFGFSKEESNFSCFCLA